MCHIQLQQFMRFYALGKAGLIGINNYQLSQVDPRDALLHAHYAVDAQCGKLSRVVRRTEFERRPWQVLTTVASLSH